MALAVLLFASAGGPARAQSQASKATAPAAHSVPTSVETAKSGDSSAPKPGNITGTVVDRDEAVIENAKITLTSEGATARESLSGSDGSFSFSNVPPGPFQLLVVAPGFATQTTSGVLQPGQDFVAPTMQMVVATSFEVEVRVKPAEVADEQIHEEEKQRVLGVIPNYYVSYLPDATPLNTRQKFELGWKSVVDPVIFGLSGAIAGVEQADNAFSGYGQGSQGFAKRYGATYADIVSGTFIGSALLPMVFKQDPRYFYKGSGSGKSRLFYALANAVICKGDNGHWQPNYSNMLGGLAAGALSNVYYPASNRNGVGLTFENALIGIGGSAVGAVFQEFLVRKLTPHTAKGSQEPAPSSGIEEVSPRQYAEKRMAE